MTWLAETPLAVVEALLGALPRLEAGESLMGVQTAALGAGTVKKDESRRMLRDLSTAAGIKTRRRASPEQLATIGIRVEIQP